MAKPSKKPKSKPAGFDTGFAVPNLPDYSAPVNDAIGKLAKLESLAKAAIQAKIGRAQVAKSTLDSRVLNVARDAIGRANAARVGLENTARQAAQNRIGAAFEKAAQIGAISQPPASPAAPEAAQPPAAPQAVVNPIGCNYPKTAPPGYQAFQVSLWGTCSGGFSGPDKVPAYSCYDGFPANDTLIPGSDWLGYFGIFDTEGMKAACDAWHACNPCGVKPPTSPPPPRPRWDLWCDATRPLFYRTACNGEPDNSTDVRVLNCADQATIDNYVGTHNPADCQPAPPPPPPPPPPPICKEPPPICKEPAPICAPIDPVAKEPSAFFPWDWCSPDVAANQLALANVDVGPQPLTIARLWGFVDDDGNDTAPEWMQGNAWLIQKYFDQTAIGAFRNIAKALDRAFERIPELAPCEWKRVGYFFVFQSIFGFLEKCTGIRFGDRLKTLDYNIGYFCPTEIPTPVEASQGYLAGQLDKDTWRTFVRAGNRCDTHEEKLMLAARSRPRGRDCVDLFRRGVISESQAQDYLRQDGYLFSSEQTYLFELTKEVPPVSDITRYMTRNVYDDAIVTAFGLDAEFEQKFRGPLPGWQVAQGITDEQMKAEWRAHWMIPAPGQLFEMFRRLRPAKEVDGSIPMGTAVTAQDVDRALGENDILPFWRKRLLEIAYHPLTRRDLQQVYQQGQIDHDGIVSAFQDVGYQPVNAERLAKTFERKFRLALRKNEWVTSYIKGGVSAGDAVANMVSDGSIQKDAESAIEWANGRITADSKERCAQAVHKRFMIGDVTQQQAREFLLAQGAEPTWIDRRLVEWGCELQTKGRAASAQELCQWLSDGLITAAEMAQRLLRVGYSAQDAQRVLERCSRGISTREAARVLKQQKEEERKQKQSKMDADKLLRMRETALKNLASGRSKRFAREMQETGLLMKQARKLAKKMSSSTDAAASLLTDAAAKLRGVPTLNESGIIQILQAAVDAYTPSMGPSIDTMVDDAIAAQATLEEGVAAEEESESTNGVPGG